MDKIIVSGGNRLNGTVKVEGAKNAVLPVIAASIMASEGKTTLKQVPTLADVDTISEVLRYMNVNVLRDENTLYIDAANELKTETPFEYVRKMRASVLVLGPLLARYGHAKVAMPGGCAIGSRPIDQHLKGLEAMGATIEVGNGYVEAFANGRLHGARIYLDFPSVGATENLMMAAALAEGTTIMENCAREPEIIDLANYINQMGGKVVGAGTETIRIEGVQNLTGVEHTIIPDRIEAGTFMVAGAITGGDIIVDGAIPAHLRSLIAKMKEMGVQIEEYENSVRVIGTDLLKPIDIKTLPYPGFPTDLQAQLMTLTMKAHGTSVLTETVFENRFMHVEEFRRMNAKAKIEGRSAIIEGPVNLQGAEVSATDLRAAAALVLAGLVSEGRTVVTELKHLDRGYVDFVGKLKGIGADIERVYEGNQNPANDSMIQSS
ncbi:UDP-N-acetylglucosamine 1-carboxyvinyltransferase [Alkalibacillus haloalkaliphilus]|uniref:UDP-N-acetylglucosamine 1-carboxyvinyltransferase n=1 Tax=Alkalibacillus haloalkaliphilus TaxID=94136 RepID=UPI002936AD2C|nr:UDP-N-acetylglucosamine 1-carboxyvinyltransferase [Alkalibacillus haloalkaliphilus]MDV2583457.1 UDP-N-acetylglucosamine 1-carboxyvinyltransferase [Alkalibacillus haloalkaliphilus]